MAYCGADTKEVKAGCDGRIGAESMKIYITGIAGLLGYSIYRCLKDREEVDGFDIVEAEVPGMSYHHISLFDTEAVEQELIRGKAEVLIHTAALVNVDECEEHPKEAEKLNVWVTAQLADMCQRHQIKMVYISTDAVFDGEEERLYTEEDKTNPVNVYGRTKREGEICVLRYPENLVFRTNLYGINLQKKQSFGEWIYQSLKENKTLHMFTDIDFSPILAEELAELIHKACQNNLGGLYHACGTGCITKYAFAIKLKEIFGLKTGTIEASVSDNGVLKARRSKHMGMSNEKLRGELQIEISTPEEGIKRFYQQIKEGESIGD